jgi:peptide subunit release factor RF-3
MSFDYQGLAFNLLDTPGRQDFSDPYIAGREFAVDSPLEESGFEPSVPP